MPSTCSKSCSRRCAERGVCVCKIGVAVMFIALAAGIAAGLYFGLA